MFPSHDLTTAVLSSKVGGVKVVQNAASQGGPLLSAKPILDFINLPPSTRLQILSAALGGPQNAAPVIAVIEPLIASGLVEQAVEQLSTKYFYAE